MIGGIKQAMMARERVALNPPLVAEMNVGPKLFSAGRFGEEVHKLLKS